MIAPNTDIYLVKVPIEIDELNQLTFSDIHSQYAYFMGCEKLYLDNATYQRKDNVIRYPSGDNYETNYDQLLKFNYCVYRNDSYSDRVFYAFIKNMRYVNDGMTEIEIETDVFQTWQFDVQYKSSFVEREHVTDDTFGKHTIPEGLDTGEYMYQPITNETYYSKWIENDPNEKTCIVVATSDVGFTPYGRWLQNPRTYNGVYSGLWYIAFPDSTELDKWMNAMQQLPSSKVEAIYAIFMAYEKLCGIGSGYSYVQESWRDEQFYCAPVNTNSGSINPWSFNRKQLYDNRILGKNYSPKNNKTLCFPYRYITISNNSGQTNEYRYELFNRDNPSNRVLSFDLYGSISPGCNIKLFPYNYNVETTATIPGSAAYQKSFANFNEGIDGAKLPVCGWLTDAFLNWLSQNGINLALGTAAQVTSIAGGAMLSAAGAPELGVGLIASGATGIANTLKTGVEHALEPDTAKGGANSGTLNFSCQRLFTPYLRSIKDEYARIIDDYFTCYGYKVNEFKIPNIHTRRYWNYIKTIDMNLTGDIPQSDIIKLKAMFNNGVTFWHDPSHFLDYSMTNSIL